MQEVVLKSLEKNFRPVPSLSGASILGDGRVSLILDIDALIDMVAREAVRVGRFVARFSREDRRVDPTLTTPTGDSYSTDLRTAGPRAPRRRCRSGSVARCG